MDESLETTADHRLGFDSPEQEVYLHLWRTYDRLKGIEERLFSQFGLSAQQYNVLRWLQAASPAGMPTMELGRRLISRGPDTTRMLDRLEKRGLIRRNRLETNRRVVEVLLTDDGQALLAEMAEPVLEMHSRQLGHLGPRQREQLIRLLKLARSPHDDDRCDWLDGEKRGAGKSDK